MNGAYIYQLTLYATGIAGSYYSNHTMCRNSAWLRVPLEKILDRQSQLANFCIARSSSASHLVSVASDVNFLLTLSLLFWKI